MTAERIKNAAKIVAEASKHHRVVCVVSAMGHTTDELLQVSSQVTAQPDRRELDALLATGEQMSATLMAMALQSLGLKAKSFSGVQAGILTDNQFGNARITHVDSKSLERALKATTIPVVTGFQGFTGYGDITTIGRGGSDTTAIVLASALKAERCDIYSDVDGVYSCDPRLVPNASKLSVIPTSEMLELARGGAQILNARSVEVARDHNVKVRVRSTFVPGDEGTLVENDCIDRSFTGLALRSNLSRVELQLEKLELATTRDLRSFPGRRMKTKRMLGELLAQSGISAELVDPIKPNPFKLLVMTSKEDSVQAASILQKAPICLKDIVVKTDVCAISLVASQVNNEHYQECVEQLSQHKISLLATAMLEQRITLMVPLAMAKQAVNVLHAHFAGIVVAA